LPRLAQTLPPVAVLAALVARHLIDGTSPSAAFPVVLLVILWLALYHSTRELLAGMVLAVCCFLTPARGQAWWDGLGHGALYASMNVLIGLSVVQLLHRLRRQAEDAEMVREIMHKISMTDAAAARIAICQGALAVSKASTAVLLEPDASGVLVATAAVPTAVPEMRLTADGRLLDAHGHIVEMQPRSLPSLDAYTTGEQVFSANVGALPPPIQSFAAGGAIRSMLAQPVIRDGRTVGVLAL